MFKLLAFVFLVSMNQSFAQKQDNNTGSSISSKDAQKILDFHNQVRKEVGVPALIWGNQLAAYAQKWADHLAKTNNCQIMHRKVPGEMGVRYGENIFWESSSSLAKPLDAPKNWYSEKKQYHRTKIAGNNWVATGHYTQMIWKDTKVVGVGIAVCANGGLIIVANYFPSGNYFGQYPY